ncbi:MAG: hypothetical protein JXA73_07695 [Acidobacteria bacterium]|nr:hypothetical protein [Acidobacteriota bacterium]
MSHLVVCPLKSKALKRMRWAVLILPIFFCGCFDEQSTTKPSSKAKETGISSVSRFFTYGQNASLPESALEGMAPAHSSYSMGIAAAPEFFEGIPENEIAMPAFMGASADSSENPFRAGGSSSRIQRSRSGNDPSSGFRNAASLIFNTPFNQVFSRVFNQAKSDDVEPAAKDDLPNPFTEARLKQEASSEEKDADASSDVKNDAAEDKTDSTKQAAEEDSNTGDDSKSVSFKPIAPSGSDGNPGNGGFLIVGDFDGSGMLSMISAQRSGDTRFISEDGERDFNLYINSAAVHDRRAFYIDDINLDEIPDILVTSATKLFGVVLLGNGAGGYQVADTFVTGYTPTVACAGPVRNGMREILSVGMTSHGFLRAFSYDEKYSLEQTVRVSFAPDYLLHLAAPETSMHYLMTAQTDGAEQIWDWGTDGLIKPAADPLGADATVLSGDFGSYSLKAYQVGNYASVVLTSQGKSFNVANMRVLDGSFIIIGDLRRRGDLDVAVADLQFFTASKSNR